MSTTLSANRRLLTIPRELPQEILDDITDIAAETCFESLPSLSLSSRCFVERSQRHIFREIKISRQRHVSQLLTLLDGKPRLMKDVRSLWLCIHQELCGSEGVSKDLGRIAGQLVGLRELRLEAGLGPRRDEFDPVCRAFFKEFASFAIVKVWIDAYIDFPVNLIRRLPISKLRLGLHSPTSLSNKEESREGEEQIATTGWQIRHFECNRDSSAALFLVGICSTSVYQTLVVLDLKIELLPQHEAAWSLIGALKNSPVLEVLILCYYCWNDYIGAFRCFMETSRSNRTLPNLPSLRCLRLILHIHTRRYGFSAMGATILPLFLAIFPTAIISGNPHPSLEVLDITHILSNLKDTQQYVDVLRRIPFGTDDQAWRSMDDLFTNRCLLPRLRALRIEIGRLYPRELNDMAVTKEYQEALENLKQKNGADIRILLPNSAKHVPIVDFGLSPDDSSGFDAASSMYHNSNLVLATW
ncbi:hypothetical protein D9611_008394 [Ephemerocybe angulata]|uniref:Uncharacterized protein n=1 Tax=Ephemerocybe angulata TaxID=980116 RepID=A0A8H5F5D0_9AGAR|nr:hypothetical protein D9611_008394 [Tulosesus angulatus]